jgi:hypothetical protein
VTAWLYERDFPHVNALYETAERLFREGFRVFIQGYSAMDCKEIVRSAAPKKLPPPRGANE